MSSKSDGAGLRPVPLVFLTSDTRPGGTGSKSLPKASFGCGILYIVLPFLSSYPTSWDLSSPPSPDHARRRVTRLAVSPRHSEEHPES